ncbi:hypothetical protein NL676_023098 [Syzygium grande]|nr:hypothetical protein NL676_023098 [Syzygium grande]
MRQTENTMNLTNKLVGMQEGLVKSLVARRKETNVVKKIPDYSQGRPNRNCWSIRKQVGLSWQMRNTAAGLLPRQGKNTGYSSGTMSRLVIVKMDCDRDHG